MTWFSWIKKYFKRGFWRIDLHLWRFYSFQRAYGISLRNRPQKRILGLTYGETPAREFFSLLSWIEMPPGFHFLELGAGTARLSLMLAQLRAGKVTAIDCIAPFVDNANRISTSLKLDDFIAKEADIFDVQWSQADVIYLTATAFSDEQVRMFHEKSLEMKRGAFLFSLTHVPKKDVFQCIQMEIISTSWGASTVYLSRRL